MATVSLDIASIVPSTRDFLQAIATRRKRLALVPLVQGADDASALAQAGVDAFAVLAPNDGMRAVSAAIGSLPLISLRPIATEVDALTARAAGADAVVVATGFDRDTWEAIAKHARTTRMVALATVSNRASADLCAAVMARGAYLPVETISEMRSLLSLLGSVRVLAHLPSVDETMLRALRGIVDAAIVDSDLYLSTSFESLREELEA